MQALQASALNPCKIMNAPCHIKVGHTQAFLNADSESSLKKGSAQRYLNAPNNSLKPAMRSIFEMGFCSDLNLRFEDKKTFNVHRAILAIRS